MHAQVSAYIHVHIDTNCRSRNMSPGVKEAMRNPSGCHFKQQCCVALAYRFLWCISCRRDLKNHHVLNSSILCELVTDLKHDTACRHSTAQHTQHMGQL